VGGTETLSRCRGRHRNLKAGAVGGTEALTRSFDDDALRQVQEVPPTRYLCNDIEVMAQQVVLGGVELLVLLALIRLGDEAYGVPISDEIEATLGRSVSVGSVYITLDRLERKGLVSSRLGEPTAERGGRAKTYFRPTAKGLREVRLARRTLMRLWQGLPQLAGKTI